VTSIGLCAMRLSFRGSHAASMDGNLQKRKAPEAFPPGALLTTQHLRSYGVKTSVWHGRPPQTSTTLPFASRKSDFWVRAATVART
jgi:hypothetical protein